MTNKEFTIDATGKKLGRVATEAASILMGKNDPSFEKHTVSGNKVVITNAAKADISEKKKSEKKYGKYSGYPGGLRFETLGDVIEKKGYGEVFARAVYGMLPGNKLRAKIMKNLTVTE
jgi:large subunit ribosomal protein L13